MHLNIFYRLLTKKISKREKTDHGFYFSGKTRGVRPNPLILEQHVINTTKR